MDQRSDLIINGMSIGKFYAQGTYKKFYTIENDLFGNPESMLIFKYNEITPDSLNRKYRKRYSGLELRLIMRSEKKKQQQDVAIELLLNMKFYGAGITPRMYGGWIFNGYNLHYITIDKLHIGIEKGLYALDTIIFLVERSACSEKVIDRFSFSRCANIDIFFNELSILVQHILDLGYCYIDIKIDNICTHNDKLLIIDLDPQFMIKLADIDLDKFAVKIKYSPIQLLKTYMMYQVYLSLYDYKCMYNYAVCCNSINMENMPHAPLTVNEMIRGIIKLDEYLHREFPDMDMTPQSMLEYYTNSRAEDSKVDIIRLLPLNSSSKYEHIAKEIDKKYTKDCDRCIPASTHVDDSIQHISPTHSIQSHAALSLSRASSSTGAFHSRVNPRSIPLTPGARRVVRHEVGPSPSPLRVQPIETHMKSPPWRWLTVRPFALSSRKHVPAVRTSDMGGHGFISRSFKKKRATHKKRKNKQSKKHKHLVNKTIKRIKK